MLNRIFYSVLVLIFSVAIGHAAPPKLKFGNGTNASENAATTNIAPATAVDSKVYKLAPNDVVQIKVFQEDDLETKARVAQDGTISLPLVGVLTLGGKTVEEAAQMIQTALKKDFLVNPQVNLIILEYAKRRFTILGQVQRPNSYDIPNEQTITLLDAIAMAGGYTRIGAPGKITVRRKIASEEKIFKLDAEAMSKEKNAKPFEILPDDVITVGERFI